MDVCGRLGCRRLQRYGRAPQHAERTEPMINALGHALVPLLVHDGEVEARGAVAPGAALLQQRLGLFVM